MSSPSLLITTLRGPIRGSADEGVRRFLGIPFAAPPTGSRRFAPPAPADSWTDERPALAYGPGPIQPVDGLSKTLGLLDDFEQSEDCLTVNVFTPEGEAEPRAVMVWLHGGAFQTGTAAGPVYDGAALAGGGDVVVVTLNYRVGALGFLATGAPESANLGLQDQVAALRWVRDEISAFGGDPARVTVFGESAGAGSIVALLAMPSARGLFQRAIIQSAAPEGILSLEEASDRARIFAQAAGGTDPDLDWLRSLETDSIAAYQGACEEPGPRRIGMFFAPFVDGVVLPTSPMQAIASGSAADVELVVGTTAQEMQLYHLLPGFAEIPEAFLPQYLATRVGGRDADALDRAGPLLAAYADPELAGLDKFFALETDASLFYPATRLAEAQSAHQPRTFMYRFNYPSPYEKGRLGACHALDVAFALGNTALVPHFAGSDEATRRVSASMLGAWSSFARSGDPSLPGLDWPTYSRADRTTLLIDDPNQVVSAPNETRRAAWAIAREEVVA
jgi:para-nitrobenzyl esterase